MPGGSGEADLNKINIKGKTIEEVKRNFVPAVPDPRGAFPNVDIYAGGACQGCLTFLRSTLDKLNGAGFLQKMGKISIVIGVNTNLPEKLRGKVYIFGDCAREHGDRGTYYPGCVPIEGILEFVKTLTGYDPPKTKTSITLVASLHFSTLNFSDNFRPFSLCNKLFLSLT